MSFIHYKFKSAKAHDSLVVDGMGMSAFDLKREIVRQKKLKGEDFDLVLVNAESGDEFRDDMALVPRNSSIIVKRIPVPDAKKRGIPAGTAKYNTDDLHMGLPTIPAPGQNAPQQQQYGNANASRTGSYSAGGGADQGMSRYGGAGGGIPGLASASSDSIPGLSGVPGSRGPGAADGGSEADRINAVLNENSSYWQATQDRMANMRRVRPNFQGGPGGPPQAGGRPGGFQPRQPGQGGPTAGRQPPPNYVCFRCNIKGHFIQDCPTNGDATFDKPKVKRTTGIPRSFLREVDAVQPDASAVMINPEGKFVQFVSNDAEWNRIQSKLTGASHNDNLALANVPVTKEYECGLCHKLLKEATEMALTSDGPLHMTCPNCKQHATTDLVLPNEAMRNRIQRYVREQLQRSGPGGGGGGHQGPGSGPNYTYGGYSSGAASLPPVPMGGPRVGPRPGTGPSSLPPMPIPGGLPAGMRPAFQRPGGPPGAGPGVPRPGLPGIPSPPQSHHHDSPSGPVKRPGDDRDGDYPRKRPHH
ncbi:Protein mpe1 [Blastocladiella emersonii ATCC 22665]|nr:Protein mpe1 [Blastocladiella emersonii ATCC 22665]